jgi:PAS domain S-box-containing protein
VARVRTLVVDDSPTLDRTASALEGDGCRVTTADSVSDALVKLRGHPTDVVVTEYRLPDGDGIELLREIRSIRDSLPVVLYTAHGSEQVASEAIQAGASSYIPKEGDESVERLCETVDEHAMTGIVDGSPGDLPRPTPEHIVRAVDEAPIGITLSDPSLPDNPMVYINEAYAELTGYDIEDVLGRNCRFLQGPETSEEPVREMREAIEAQEPVSVELLNYREDGTPFWNQVTIAPIFDDDGELLHYVGFQNDVTDRKEAEALARQRADSLREERQALERVLARISGLVNDVSHLLVNAESREEIERQVCQEITARDEYCHAWIGELTAAGSRLAFSTVDGTDGQLLESETSTDWLEFEGGPLSAETVGVFSDDSEIPSSIAPATVGATTMAAVPLSYRRTIYGVLCVYTDQSGVFDRRECRIFEALGQMVASGINAVETKKVLTADRVTELGFEITDESFPLIDLATTTGGTISYNGATIRDVDSLRVFVTLSDAPGEFETVIDRCESITDGFVVARQDGRVTVSLELEDDDLFKQLAEYGARLRELSVSGRSGTAQLHIDLPVEGDVRSVVSVLESRYDGVNLVRQREREREPRPTAEFTATVAERLTDRQYTAIETAYLSNYFEFPRPVAGEELAESMGISRQTYHQHLRAAQRKLLEEFFDSDS